MTTEPTSTQVKAEPGFFTGMNPFILTLAWIWIITFGIAFILAMIGSTEASHYDDNAAGRFLWASIFSGVGLSALFTWLLACALTWKPAPGVPVKTYAPIPKPED